MFKKQLCLLFGLAIALMMLTESCKSKFEQLKASNDYAKINQEAIKYYYKKDYAKAIELFDILTPRFRGQEQAEDLFYYYAYANYKSGDYTSAQYQFKNFADTYQSSPRAEECRFMAAYCYYLDSPIYSLDQENTTKAIEALQFFINYYPKSDRVPEASKLIQDLRGKLEQKSYADAKLYLTIGDYQSAVIAFGNSLRDYPDTKYAEEMEFLTIQAQYLYAKNSRIFKQEERYNQAMSLSDEFAEKYPNSKYLKEAANLKKDSQNGINSVKAMLADAENEAKLAKKLARKDTVKTSLPSEKGNDNQKMN